MDPHTVCMNLMFNANYQPSKVADDGVMEKSSSRMPVKLLKLKIDLGHPRYGRNLCGILSQMLLTQLKTAVGAKDPSHPILSYAKIG